MMAHLIRHEVIAETEGRITSTELYEQVHTDPVSFSHT